MSVRPLVRKRFTLEACFPRPQTFPTGQQFKFPVHVKTHFGNSVYFALTGDATGASDISDDDVDEDVSDEEARALREEDSADAAGSAPAKAEESPEDLMIEGKRRRTPVDYRILNFVSPFPAWIQHEISIKSPDLCSAGWFVGCFGGGTSSHARRSHPVERASFFCCWKRTGKNRVDA